MFTTSCSCERFVATEIETNKTDPLGRAMDGVFHNSMETEGKPRVAVLLTTYNGSIFINEQITSLTRNSTPFTLHWFDDHSTDDTRQVVRASITSSGLDAIEWSDSEHKGVPGAFFQLMEKVDADIYLFCDQDDIWQAGKVDATVASLLPVSGQPVLCFSEALVFEEGISRDPRPIFDFVGATSASLLRESRALTSNPALGNTIGFTRPLRDMFLRHSNIARAYAPSHDCWMYLIAVAAGESRLLRDVPTTLYRLHGGNLFGGNLRLRGLAAVARRWRLQVALRRWASQQARGFEIGRAHV